MSLGLIVPGLVPIGAECPPHSEDGWMDSQDCKKVLTAERITNTNQSFVDFKFNISLQTRLLNLTLHLRSVIRVQFSSCCDIELDLSFTDVPKWSNTVQCSALYRRWQTMESETGHRADHLHQDCSQLDATMKVHFSILSSTTCRIVSSTVENLFEKLMEGSVPSNLPGLAMISMLF